MDLFSLENLGSLSETEAVRLRLAERNLAVLPAFLLIMAVVAVGELAGAAERQEGLALLLATVHGAANLTLLLALRLSAEGRVRSGRLVSRLLARVGAAARSTAQPVVFTVVILHYILFILYVASVGGEQVWPFIFPFVILLFRFSAAELAFLHGTAVLVAGGESLFRTGGESTAEVVIASLGVNVFAGVVGWILTRRSRR